MKIVILFTLCFFTNITFSQNRGDIVISEIFADPSPIVGLPNAEFVELKNNSTNIINLSGWKLSDGTSTATLANFNLKPDSSVAICSSSALANFLLLGAAFSVTNFPSLDNDNDQIILIAPSQKIIHAINYFSQWHTNQLKKDGGWSLEMIDTKNICSQEKNYKSSIDLKGGTPGKTNSINALNPDITAPIILNSFAIDANNIIIVFSEPIDSTIAADVNKYQITGLPIASQVKVLPPFFNKVQLTFTTPLIVNTVYPISIQGVLDCSNTPINNTKINTGLPSLPDSFDIIINEVLFNPKTSGTDFIEIYNLSNKIIDFKNLFIANRNAISTIANIKNLSLESRLIFPKEYYVFSDNKLATLRDYNVTNPTVLLELPALPSMNDDSNNILVLNSQGKIIDELAYSNKWHFPLIQNEEGVSLERLSFTEKTNNKQNWFSAATTVGYATPTYKNSQTGTETSLGNVTITPSVFSPDLDGFDDIANINFEFTEPGFVANITIFDIQGRVVKNLQRNALLGKKGSFIWNGISNKNEKIQTGIYIVYFQIFNLKGKKQEFKKEIVVAYK